MNDDKEKTKIMQQNDDNRSGRARVNPFSGSSNSQFFDRTNVPDTLPQDNFNNIISGDLDVDPKSLKSVDKIINKNKRFVVIMIIAIVAILAFGFAIFMGVATSIKSEYGAKPQDDTTVAPTTQVPKKTIDESNGIKGQSNPVEAAKITPVDPPAEVLVTLDGNNALNFSVDNQSKHHVVFPSITDKITTASTGCTLKDANADCFFGSAKINNKDVQLYAFKDASTSSLLYTSTDPQTVQSQGAELAYIAPMDNGSTKQYALVVVFNDDTGFMVVSDDSTLLTKVANDSAKHMVVQGQ